MNFKKSKDRWFLIILSLVSGVLLMASVVLTWPKTIPRDIKYYWRFILVFILVAETYKMKYEISVLPEKLKAKEGIDFQMDKLTLGFTVFIATALFAPGIYYAYKLSFL